MLMVFVSVYVLFIGCIKGQVQQCGVANVGLGLFGCDLQTTPIWGSPDTCYTAIELQPSDPDVDCSFQYSCDCSSNQMTINIYNSQTACTNQRSSTTLTAGSTQCTVFDTCRGNYQARVIIPNFQSCCACSQNMANETAKVYTDFEEYITRKER
eukprot:370709_1